MFVVMSSYQCKEISFTKPVNILLISSNCVIPEEAENVRTQTMEGIICQTIPQPLRNFQMKGVVFLWMFIS